MLLIAFSILRLLNGLLFLEVVQTPTAISTFHAMLINCVYFPYLFKSNTMQCISPIIHSQRQPNLEKSKYKHFSKVFNRPGGGGTLHKFGQGCTAEDIFSLLQKNYKLQI